MESKKVFEMDDTDGGRNTLVIAYDVVVALELFKKAYGSYPERIKDLTADQELVIIQDLIEPVFEF